MASMAGQRGASSFGQTAAGLALHSNWPTRSLALGVFDLEEALFIRSLLCQVWPTFYYYLVIHPPVVALRTARVHALLALDASLEPLSLRLLAAASNKN